MIVVFNDIVSFQGDTDEVLFDGSGIKQHSLVLHDTGGFYLRSNYRTKLYPHSKPDFLALLAVKKNPEGFWRWFNFSAIESKGVSHGTDFPIEFPIDFHEEYQHGAIFQVDGYFISKNEENKIYRNAFEGYRKNIFEHESATINLELIGRERSLEIGEMIIGEKLTLDLATVASVAQKNATKPTYTLAGQFINNVSNVTYREVSSQVALIKKDVVDILMERMERNNQKPVYVLFEENEILAGQGFLADLEIKNFQLIDNNFYKTKVKIREVF